MVKNVSSYSSIRHCLDRVPFPQYSRFSRHGLLGMEAKQFAKFLFLFVGDSDFFRNFAGADSGRTRLRQDAGVGIGRVHYILKMRR